MNDNKEVSVILRTDTDICKELEKIVNTLTTKREQHQMTMEDFVTNMRVQTLRNQIIDCENDITAMVEGLRVKSDELSALKLMLHAIENPGKPYVGTDLF